jgi:hypothetical protein
MANTVERCHPDYVYQGAPITFVSRIPEYRLPPGKKRLKAYEKKDDH